VGHSIAKPVGGSQKIVAHDRCEDDRHHSRPATAEHGRERDRGQEGQERSGVDYLIEQQTGSNGSRP
jgi:hypothetical protein